MEPFTIGLDHRAHQAHLGGTTRAIIQSYWDVRLKDTVQLK
jgi:hypothetical protein